MRKPVDSPQTNGSTPESGGLCPPVSHLDAVKESLAGTAVMLKRNTLSSEMGVLWDGNLHLPGPTGPACAEALSGLPRDACVDVGHEGGGGSHAPVQGTGVDD